jgi:hypothetical protein
LAEWWPEVYDGIESALNNSDNLQTMRGIYDYLASGDWVLWLVLEDGDLLGAALTEILTTAKGLYCNVPFGYSKDPRRDIHQYFFPHIEEIARELEFAGVKFISKRPGYARKAKSMGYERGFVEYRKEF